MTNKKYLGYHAVLDGANDLYFRVQEYSFIGWRTGLSLDLHKTNQNKAHCSECKRELKPGEGIYKQYYGQRGYICLEDARKIILTVGNLENKDFGFTINVVGNLQKCSGDYGVGKITSQQVVDSIKKIDAE